MEVVRLRCPHSVRGLARLVPGVLLGAALLSLLSSCSDRGARDPTTLVERSLPSVVLLPKTAEDGTRSYGAGVVVDASGLVLTNKHVVDGSGTLQAMLHRQDRPSYTPLDGGLSRYLFEHERELRPALVLRTDASLDLAVVQTRVEPGEASPLPPCARAPRLGEPVLALGHPQEAVWSFTSGVVSAIHQGAIQHDAAVNAGNSGGPLLDEQGCVLGINTTKILGGSEGMAFAQPIDIAMRVVDSARDLLAVDRSTPEKAARSCIEAQELGSAATLQCYDWDWKWQRLQDEVRFLDTLGFAQPGALAQAIEREGGHALWSERRQQGVLGFFQGSGPSDEPPAKGKLELLTRPPDAVLERAGLDLEVWKRLETQARERLREREEQDERQLIEKNRLVVALNDGETVRKLLKSGIRVESVEYLQSERAWVHIAGRNPDGSRYGWTELYHLRDGAWVQIEPALEADTDRLPQGWPPPFIELETQRWGTRLSLLSWYAWRGATESEREEARAKVRERWSEVIRLAPSEQREGITVEVVGARP